MHRLVRRLSVSPHLKKRGKLPNQFGYLNRENSGESDIPFIVSLIESSEKVSKIKTKK